MAVSRRASLHIGPPPPGRILEGVTIDEPWLSWIVEGRKTYEGRVKKGKWDTV